MNTKLKGKGTEKRSIFGKVKLIPQGKRTLTIEKYSMMLKTSIIST